MVEKVMKKFLNLNGISMGVAISLDFIFFAHFSVQCINQLVRCLMQQKYSTISFPFASDTWILKTTVSKVRYFLN